MNHLNIIRSLDIHSTKYENIVLLGDFNACVDDEALQTFLNNPRVLKIPRTQAH